MGIWILGLSFLRRCRGVDSGSLTTESMVLDVEVFSRGLRARARSSRSLRFDGYGTPGNTDLSFLPRDLGRLIGPEHSVVTVALIGSVSKWKSLTDLMLGATRGVLRRVFS